MLRSQVWIPLGARYGTIYIFVYNTMDQLYMLWYDSMVYPGCQKKSKNMRVPHDLTIECMSLRPLGHHSWFEIELIFVTLCLTLILSYTNVVILWLKNLRWGQLKVKGHELSSAPSEVLQAIRWGSKMLNFIISCKSYYSKCIFF